MITYIAGILIALLVLGLGELLKNETKEVYVKEGYSWSKVILLSNLFAIIGGILIIAILEYTNIPKEFAPELLPFAITVTAYITAQSFMTDLKILMINRNILRVAYISMYAISLYNITTNEMFKHNWLALLLFTLLLIFIFIFSSIGASDVRAMAVALPYVLSIGGYDAIGLFVISLLFVAAAMGLRNIIRDRERMKKFKQDNMDTYKGMNKLVFYHLAKKLVKEENSHKETGTAVGPYMISPFLIFLFIYPFLVN